MAQEVLDGAQRKLTCESSLHRVTVCKQCKPRGALWREPITRATMPAGTQVRFRPAVISRSSPHFFTPPHFLSKILHCPIQIKAKKPINKSLKSIKMKQSSLLTS